MRKTDSFSRRDFAAWMAGGCLGVSLLPTAGLPASPRGRAARNLIYLFMSGGMTHLDTFDPKPGADTQGPVQSIPSSVSGQRVSQYLPRMAQLMDKVAVVNSLHTTTGAHEEGRYVMRTGYPMRGTIRHPAIGSWMLRMDGSETQRPVLPGFVLIGGGSNDASAGFFETRYAPLPLGSAAGGLPNSKARVSQEQFLDRLTLADAFDQPFRRRYQQKQVRAYTDLYADAIRLMTSEELDVFDITKESDQTRMDYGNHPFGQGCLLARRLIEQDVRCVEVHLGGWDTHNDNFNAIGNLVPVLDRGMSALLRDLDARGLLQSTLVVLATEFGRTPTINVNRGRDHHPAAFTGLLAGGPVKAGQSFGKTDPTGTEITDSGITIPDFHATIGKALGLDLDTVVKSASGRPFTFADHGKPVGALV